MLYILCSEVLACNIRTEKKIHGFLLPGARGQEFKIRQYADDSTCFVKDLYSLSVPFSILLKYERGSGAKLNYSKTEAMWLGAWRACPETPLGLTWVTKMKVLGVWYSNGLVNVDPDNWQSKLNKLEKNLNLWKSRSLSFVGKALIINTLGASKFWFLAKLLPTPEWVISRFKMLVFNFLWNSKIETVSRQTLSAPVKDGGLGIIDFLPKSKALLISLAVSTIENHDSKAFYLTKYFIGSQLAKLRPEFPVYWRSAITHDLPIKRHWSLVRDHFTENYKNDIAWLITLRGTKIRDSLKSWGYIATDSCAYCQHKETIDHCFLNCPRAKRVWSLFSPTLSALLAIPFVANVKTVFFYLWAPGPMRKHRVLSRQYFMVSGFFVIKQLFTMAPNPFGPLCGISDKT